MWLNLKLINFMQKLTKLIKFNSFVPYKNYHLSISLILNILQKLIFIVYSFNFIISKTLIFFRKFTMWLEPWEYECIIKLKYILFVVYIIIKDTKIN